MTAISRRMFRYTVPVDDQPHVIPLSHSPVAVAISDFVGRCVEFWAESTEGATQVKRAFQVFGTGHPLPEDAKWIGTCPRTAGGLVFHLYELPRPTMGQLWDQAKEDPGEYRRLLREHGHILAPGDAGYDPDAPRTLPCGWSPDKPKAAGGD